MTDFAPIIRYIAKVGRMTYGEIGARVGVPENRIARIACGVTKQVDYDLGCALRILQSEIEAKAVLAARPR